MSVACPSCQSPDTRRLGEIPAGYEFAGRKLDHPLPGGTLHTCPECRLSFRWPRPSPEKLEELYAQTDLEHWRYTPVRRDDWYTAREWLLARYGTGSVLDVGCFDGAFLDYLGGDWNRSGIEINEEAGRMAEHRGVKIIGREAEAPYVIPEPLDAAVAFDLIEHVADPRLLVRRMSEAVRPGGAIVIGSGNTEARSWRLLGSRYWYCTIPEHLSFIGESWCGEVARTYDLDVALLHRFSHDPDRTFGRIVYQLAVNLVYRYAPSMARMLRRAGVGEVDASKHDDLQDFPPMWTTARDHLLVIFIKRAS